MTDFICPTCRSKFDDIDELDLIDCDNIRRTGECVDCESDLENKKL
jgi:hypothetical protein